MDTAKKLRPAWALLAACSAVAAGSTPGRCQTGGTGAVEGIVWDSTRAVALQGAEVFVVGTARSVRTDGSGRFVLTGLEPGTCALSFRHARLELLGWAAEGVSVDVAAGRTTSVVLAIPENPRSRSEGPAVSRPTGPRGEPAIVVGSVLDGSTGRAVAGAEVFLRGGGGRIVSDDRGRFVLFDVPVGPITVVAERIGYSPREAPVEMKAGTTVELHIPLSVEAVELKPIEVEVRSAALEAAGFYTRADDPGVWGVFVTAAEIERRAPTSFTALFTGIPGARVDYYGPGKTAVMFTRKVGMGDEPDPGRPATERKKGADGCTPDLYVDGLRIRGSWDFLSPAVIAAMEVYVGATAPIEFATSSCGVVLAWTRR